MKAGFVASCSTLSLNSGFLATCFVFILIDFSRKFEHFLLFFVTLSFKGLLYFSGVVLLMLFVWSENIRISEDEFILEKSPFNCFWKSSVSFLNFRALAISKSSFSNVSNSFITPQCQDFVLT